MNIDADENAAPSSLERVIRHLETRVLDCNLSILGRALLISTLEEAHEATVPALLALSPTGFAQLATQRGSEAGVWQHQLSFLTVHGTSVHALCHYQGVLYN